MPWLLFTVVALVRGRVSTQEVDEQMVNAVSGGSMFLLLTFAEQDDGQAMQIIARWSHARWQMSSAWTLRREQNTIPNSDVAKFAKGGSSNGCRKGEDIGQSKT